MGDIRDVIQEDGLVAAVQLLDTTFEGNRETLARVIEDSTGLTAAFQILDADAATIADTFGTVANSGDLLGDAFGQLATSDSFRLDQAMNDLKVSLVTLGARGSHLIVNTRKFTGVAFTNLDQLPERDMISPPVAGFLSAAVKSGLSAVFSGAPGAGKTTILSCCAAEIDPSKRVVVAEEVFEADVPLANVG